MGLARAQARELATTGPVVDEAGMSGERKMERPNTPGSASMTLVIPSEAEHRERGKRRGDRQGA